MLGTALAHADIYGLETYLESTDTAKLMYLAHGFHTMGDLNFDPADFGHTRLPAEHQTVMVRPAVDRDGKHWSRRKVVV